LLRRTIEKLNKEQPLQLISLGEELFRERLRGSSFQFEQEASRSTIGGLIDVLHKLNRGNIVANILIQCRRITRFS
jgi:hypothetical protein